MKINAKKLLWALPLVAIGFSAIVSLLFFRSTTQLLDGLGATDSPTLSQSQTLIFELNHISDGLKSGVAAADKDLVDQAFKRADKFREDLSRLSAIPGQAQTAAAISAALDAYVKAGKAVATALLDGKGDDPAVAAQAMQAAIKALDTQLDNHKQAAQKALDDHIAQARLLTQQALVANLLASLVTLLLSLGVSWLSVRSLMRQLGGAPEEATNIVQRIASGDLSQPVHLNDNNEHSLLHAMRGMQTQLARVIGDVRQAVQQVHSAADGISGGNQALAERSTRQASSLQTSANRITELTHSVLSNADSAERAHQLARHASQQADQGNRAVADAVDAMGEISDRARKIVDITALIDGIAFQTNILALNAAVEAARAGEQGRGFAVVAGEVRTLAQRAGAAAKDIKGLIDDSAARIEAGAQHVNAAGRAMNELVGSVKQVGEHIGTISTASARQRSGIEEVNQAVAELGRATEQNQALVHEAGEASSALQAVARQLGDAVGQFNVTAAAAHG